MLSLNQLESWFADTEEIIFEISVLQRNLERLGHPRSANEKAVLQDAFFLQLQDQLRFILSIQICKLFINKDTERRNFRKLFNRLKYEKYDEALKKRLKANQGKIGMVCYKADVIRLVDTLIPFLESGKEAVLKIKILRDRLYAHSDPGKQLPEVSLKEFSMLTEISVGIFNSLSDSMMGSSFQFDDRNGWQVDHVLESLTVLRSYPPKS